jgi:pyruvate dehydrogenase E2 component (dihydrolipoamide acetyltransferase)
MPINILMPALSPTMTEGNLAKWLKKEGDSVKAGEVIAEIETDKATMEVEAVDEGIIGKILIAEGTENVAVNTLIAILLEEGEDASAITEQATVAKADVKKEAAAVETKVEAVKPTQTMQSSSSDRIIASPVAKRLAAHENVDLSNLEGSGPRGRIIKADVEKAKLAGPVQTTPMLKPAGISYSDMPLNNMRKTIAKRLLESKQTIPHFYLTMSCELDELLKLRTMMNNRTNAPTKISVNDFVIKASAKALQEVPDANVTFHDTYIRKFNNVDISVAVSIDGGLITPVLRNLESQSLPQISMNMKQMAEKARSGKLKPEEYQGGSFTISNLGMFGVEQFHAIINPPQSCILAVGSGAKKLVMKDGAIKEVTVMQCTLSVDHRAIDGVLGANFLAKFKEYIENPVLMLMD